jgi:long-chain acyl-CoA synthetase
MPRLTTTLPGLLERTAAKSASETALLFFGCRITYRQLLDHSNRLAAGLQAMGLEKGDRVALLLPNCPQFVIAFFGALQAGAIVTTTSPMYTARELIYQWNDAGVKVVIADRRLLPVIKTALRQLPSVRQIVLTGLRQYYPKQFVRLCASLKTSSKARASKVSKSAFANSLGETKPGVHNWEQVLGVSRFPRPHGLSPADVACLQYTGGTTGTSKAAMLTHANLVTNTSQFYQTMRLGAKRQEVAVAALPLFHIYAMLCVMIASVRVGGAVIILPRFELRAALNVIRLYRPTIFHGVPTMYVAFNSVPDVKKYGIDSLKLCTSGGGPLPVEVLEKFQKLTGGRLVEGYGLTETSPVTHFNPPFGVRKAGSIGPCILETEARIMDLETGTCELPVGEIGEMVIRGPQVMKGYWNKPEETALALRDGWLYTGDIAKKDAEGYYYIVDRKKDMIIAGGYKIYPREVEEVLFGCPKVKEAGVVGAPDSYRGETVTAFVVLREGVTAAAEEIIAFCRERLAAYKVPRQIIFREALPKSGVGKYLRRELRNLLPAKTAADAGE